MSGTCVTQPPRPPFAASSQRAASRQARAGPEGRGCGANAAGSSSPWASYGVPLPRKAVTQRRVRSAPQERIASVSHPAAAQPSSSQAERRSSRCG